MQDGYDQTLSGLLRKRAELAASMGTLRAKLDADTVALDAIEAAIRVFQPELSSEFLPINRYEVPHSDVTGQLSRFLLDLFRESEGKAVRTLEAADALMVAKGMNPHDRIAATIIRKRVTDAYRRLRKKGLVTGRRFGSGTEMEWRLTQG